MKSNCIILCKPSLRTGLLFVCFFVAASLLTGCGREEMFLAALGKEEARQTVKEDGEEAIETENASDGGEDVSKTEEAESIFVHVCGAVKNPGVYELPAGSRLYEAVEKAGGYAEDAAADYLNMAASLADGSRLEIPTEEEAGRLEKEEKSAGGQQTKSAGVSADGRVNINAADIQTLCTLPGIGEGRAKAIIEYREKQGGFKKKEDIMQVSGIGEKMYARMESSLTVE